MYSNKPSMSYYDTYWSMRRSKVKNRAHLNHNHTLLFSADHLPCHPSSKMRLDNQCRLCFHSNLQNIPPASLQLHNRLKEYLQFTALEATLWGLTRAGSSCISAWSRRLWLKSRKLRLENLHYKKNLPRILVLVFSPLIKRWISTAAFLWERNASWHFMQRKALWIFVAASLWNKNCFLCSQPRQKLLFTSRNNSYYGYNHIYIHQQSSVLF